MTKVTIHQAKTNLSRLIAEVAEGGEVVILKGKTPVARLLPIDPPSRARKRGAWKGRIEIADAFFDPLPEDELAAWEGGND